MNVSLTPELELSGVNYFFGTIRQRQDAAGPL
jgi:hypothetical protein